MTSRTRVDITRKYIFISNVPVCTVYLAQTRVYMVYIKIGTYSMLGTYLPMNNLKRDDNSLPVTTLRISQPQKSIERRASKFMVFRPTLVA